MAAKPIRVPPSGSFDGADGSWSTFFVNAGNQNFKLLAATSYPATMLPGDSSWCDFPSAEICAQSRGLLPYNGIRSYGYQINASGDYQDLGIFGLEMMSLSEPINGRYGLDTIGFGLASTDSPSLVRQPVVMYSAQNPFLGSLGLSIDVLNFGSGGVSSFLTHLNASNAIPSLSYSYSAGARYRKMPTEILKAVFSPHVGYKGVPGSLTLGGYDRSRVQEGTTISMPSSTNYSLVVGVQSILIELGASFGNTVHSATAETAGFYAQVDSTFPYFWLPKPVCDVFEKLFMLTYDNTTGMYLVNSTAANQNHERNARIVIQIGDDSSVSGDSVSIEFPYDAFDLLGSFPLFANATRFFPLRRAIAGKNIIGRTFLQESMLIVDYERKNFTVARAQYTNPMPGADIVAITRPQTTDRQSNVLPIVLAVSSALVFSVMVAAILIKVRRKRQTRSTTRQRQIYQEMDSTYKVETQAKEHNLNAAVELPSPFSAHEKVGNIVIAELPGCAK